MTFALLAALLLQAESPVGMYDGGQMELAAGLELSADGRFRYALSYGALDEEAAGRWIEEDGRILLIGDPVTPPTITLIEQSPGQPGKVRVALDIPRGVNRQYFDVRLAASQGNSVEQMGEDGATLDLPPSGTVNVSVTFAMFDLESAAVPVDAKAGATLRFAFALNDIGKVAFDRTALARDGDALILARHGRTLRFRKVD